MNKLELIAFRDFLPTDLDFIEATWVRGLYFGNSWFRTIKKDIYEARYRQIIQGLLKKPGVSVSIACLNEDPDIILGYSVFEPQILHWVFVKKIWRGIGLAKDLIPKDTQVVTHLTKRWDLKQEFNPFLI